MDVIIAEAFKASKVDEQCIEEVEDGGGLNYARNELFEKAVTTQTWEVDKALSCGLDEVLTLLPNGKIVGYEIGDFGGIGFGCSTML